MCLLMLIVIVLRYYIVGNLKKSFRTESMFMNRSNESSVQTKKTKQCNQ